MQQILRKKITQILFTLFIVASMVLLQANTEVANAVSNNANATDNIPNAKAFTVTKKVAGSSEEVLVGEYDTFMKCVENMDINDATSLYTVYVNKDTVIPATEGMHGRSNNKIRLTSGKGGPYKLTRKGPKDFMSVQQGAEITVDNITLDGARESECLSALTGGKVTIGKGAIIQNFSDVVNTDGPALYVNGGTLTIEDGAVIRNNTSNVQGGVIQSRQGSILNIKGGLFENNSSTTSGGGAIASFGQLKITGGTFKGNKVPDKKVAGAILIGKKNPATIENARFEENEASTGGAIFSSQELTIKNTTFSKNQANWGGAICSVKKLTISKSIFDANIAKSAGGALYLNKDNGGADISESQFTNNVATSDGGAIYTYKVDNNDPTKDTEAYKNISTDENTLFKGNQAISGKYTAPENYADYTQLLFSGDSDAAQASNSRKSLLNNNDINYKNPYLYVNFVDDAKLHATRKVETGKAIDTDALTNESMPKDPTKDGYTFKEWNTKADGKGDAFTGASVVNGDMTVYAIYTKDSVPTPDPTPAPNPEPNQPTPTPELKPQPEKHIGMISKTGESASFAGLITALGFSIAGLVILRKKKMMEEKNK
ncbi:InlB B-repeat-containing protein [Amygdalobacter indicium]|uniref:InlB B-repeat-containing protein n=1 Tax=Amygdalobacter indicium TaxID=3029272 RepID=A0ABY8C3J0_9FIRM|nr:InlB B-repeat-containing protein [Amygdalobacter indicium]WEG35245.1 InlB B-repeat-containing protein [Amygdalobacter indicium]